MGFTDFWNDLWDGGGIGGKAKPGDPKSFMDKRRKEDQKKKLAFTEKNYKRPTSSGYKGKPSARPMPSMPKDNWAVNKPFDGSKYRTGPEYVANQERMREDQLIEDILGNLGNNGGGLGDLFSDQTGFLNQSRDTALKALSDALSGNLSALGDVRNNARSNFETSDANLASMHNAFQRDISTNGRKAFEGIRDEHVGNIEDTTESGTNRLSELRSKQLAERAAMLKNLGIEAAGAQNDQPDVLNQGIGYLNKVGANNEQFANSMGAANLARNQGMATAVGNEGLERRSDLQSQLDSILTNLGMQEATVKNNYNSQKSELEMGFGQQQAELGMQQKQLEMEQGQAELEQQRLILADIHERRAAEAQSEAEAAENDRKFQESMAKLEYEWQQRNAATERELRMKAQLGMGTR